MIITKDNDSRKRFLSSLYSIVFLLSIDVTADLVIFSSHILQWQPLFIIMKECKDRCFCHANKNKDYKELKENNIFMYSPYLYLYVHVVCLIFNLSR